MKHALNLLMEQLDRQQDDLGRRMANVQARLQKTLQTRDSLDGYLMDYRHQQIRQGSQSGGQTGAQLRSQGRFLTRIEGVLEQQAADVTKLQSELDRISADLLQVRVQRLRYEALLTRIATREEQMRNQRDQKVTDELSGRRAAAKAIAARRRIGP